MPFLLMRNTLSHITGLTLFLLISGSHLTGCGPAQEPEHPEMRRSILLVIENISDAEQTYRNTEDEPVVVAFAPGVYSVLGSEEMNNPIFTPGSRASAELEALAEAGDPMPMRTSLAPLSKSSGLTGDQENADYEESPLLPGKKSVLPLRFEEGDTLVFAMMLGPSNDTFLGTAKPIDLSNLEEGIWEFGADELAWWDAGTEVNEPLGHGAHQPASSPGVASGEAQEGVITAATYGDEEAKLALPEVRDVIRITVTHP